MPESRELPMPFSREQALARGWTRHQVCHRVRTGQWLALRRGWYAEATRFHELGSRARHLVSLVATLRYRGAPDVGSHLSAAAAWGWPLPFNGSGPATVTSPDLARSGRRRASLVVQIATLPQLDVRHRTIRIGDDHHTIALTSPARTLADCLRHLRQEDAVAIMDAAIRMGDSSIEAVREVLDRQEPWPYLANGRHGLELVDPRRESYLESYSFVRLAHRGLHPEPQVTIRDATGRFVARVDGWLDEHAIALEADGRAKYLSEAGDAPSTGDVVRSVRSTMAAQMERELELRSLGVTVVRWGTSEAVRHPDRLAGRVEAAKRTASRAAFTGTVERADPCSLRHPTRVWGTAHRPERRKPA
ncbi:hypothetical protein [Angustibacter luteus]|uniref:Type IV toxin-antitoxin system AbiEi family antitoxin domain-containing protein n=1 Tax=Angustibacter luteus TaxID=658456 RepID=A0ABW1JCW4_9ACTN